MEQLSQQPSALVRLGLLSPEYAASLTPAMLTTLASLPVALYVFKRVLYPTVDSREPPVVRPTIPFVGHVISLIREKTRVFERLYKESPLPICSLPMLNGWLYVINSPSLISVAMRHRDLSFDPFVIEFSSAALGMTKQQIKAYSDPANLEAMTAAIHKSLAGDNLHRLNVSALTDVAKTLNAIHPGAGLNVPDVFSWLQTVLAMATTNALFGKNNPFGPEDARDFGEYEQGIGLLALGVAPSLLAPEAIAARNRMQDKLRPYYVDHLDEADDVSALIKNRVAIHRRLGIPDDQLSIMESSLTFAATANTIPALSWLFVNVFASASFVSRIRDEVAPLTFVSTDDSGRRTATVDVSRLEKEAPMLFACYRESLRVYSDAVGNRRVMRDTTLTDPDTGREYLLRKGITVQWATRLPHALETVWGQDVAEFRPERWIDSGSSEEKKRRGAMIPFGGGKTLCPGRYFAQAETLGLVAALALGFEVEGVRVPDATVAYMGTAIKRPAAGKSEAIRIVRRAGWEDVEWSFKFESRAKSFSSFG